MSEFNWLTSTFKMADEAAFSKAVDCTEARSDDLPKKYLIKLSQDNAAHSFLNEHRPLGNINNVAKTAKKEQFVDAIASCFSAKGLKPWKLEEMTMQVKAVKDQRSQGRSCG
ncbi:peptidyl-prolyl cis-trans isomerase FKBP3-like [Stigmatopora argus]